MGSPGVLDQGEPTMPAARTNGDAGSALDAFVSYSRKDRDFAVLLEKALKAYRAPKDLDGAPQRHLTVFRDENDIAGGDYYDAIERFLQRSRKLIVVCTPSARASIYVDDEIERFIRLHGAQNVVPVLLAGRPNAEATDPADAAFPQALAGALKMPLAVSFIGFDKARDRRIDRGAFEGPWYQLLSTLLELPRHDIEQRDKRRQQRSRRIAGGIAAGVIALLSTALVFVVISRNEAIAERRIAEMRQREAEEQRRIAEDRRRAALARQLTVEADATPLDSARGIQRGLLLRLESLAAAWTVEGQAALLLSLDRLAPPPIELQPAHRVPVISLAFHVPAGGASAPSRLASAGRDGIRISELGSSAAAQQLPPGRVPAPVAFSPDGKLLLAGCRESRACLWSSGEAGWTVLRPLDAGPPLRSAAFSPDGRLLAISAGPAKEARLFDVPSGRRLRWIDARCRSGPNVAQVFFAREGGVLVALGEGGDFVRAWDLASHQLVAPIAGDCGDAAQASALPTEPKAAMSALRSHANGDPRYSDDGRWLAYIDRRDRSAVVQGPLAAGEASRIVPPAMSLAFAPDGRLAVGHVDGRVLGWHFDRPETARIASAGATAIALDRAGKTLALLDAAGKLQWRATADGQPLTAAASPASGATALDFSPDGRAVLASGEAALHVFLIGDGRPGLSLDGASGELGWAANARWLVLRGAGRIRRFDAAAGWREAPAIESDVPSVVESPDGAQIAARSMPSYSRGIGLTQPSITRVWDAATGQQLAWLSHEDEDLARSMFSLGRAKNASGEWTTARSGGDAALAAAAARWQPVLSLAQGRTPTLRWISTADARGIPLATVHLERAQRAHKVRAWAYSADGGWFATAGADDLVRLWRIAPADLAAQACARIARNLDEEEWHKAFGDEPYRATCPGLKR
jgi:WD40 repeat protein